MTPHEESGPAPRELVADSRTIARVVLTIVGVLAVLYLLYLVRDVLELLFVAGFLAIALAPAVVFFQRLRLPRALAILAVYVVGFLVLFGIGLLLVPPLVDQVEGFVADVPGYVDQLENSATFQRYDEEYGISDSLRQQAEGLPGRIGSLVGVLESVTVGAFGRLAELIIVLTITFFLLLDSPRILGFLFKQLDPERERQAREFAVGASGAVGGYVAGALAISLLAALATFGMLEILGVPFSIPLAVLMAFFALIPLVGTTIGGAIVAVVAAFHDFPTALIVWTVFFVVYQQLQDRLLVPFVYRRTVALHPLLTIVAVLVGASQLGILGALIAIPVAATVQIVIRDAWQVRQERIEAGEGAAAPGAAPG